MTEVLYYFRSIILLNKFHKCSKHLHKLHESKEQKVRHVISPPSQVKSSSLCKWLRWEGAFPGEGLLVQIDQVGACLAHFLTV